VSPPPASQNHFNHCLFVSKHYSIDFHKIGGKGVPRKKQLDTVLVVIFIFIHQYGRYKTEKNLTKKKDYTVYYKMAYMSINFFVRLATRSTR